MSYFINFPVRYYKLDGKEYLIPNITRRIKFNIESKNDASAFIDHIIPDHQSPQMLSTVLYGDSNYDWIIFLFNDIYDIHDQWPMDTKEFDNYMSKKYTLPNLYDIHHYETKDGYIVSVSHPSYDRVSVSNYEHESKLNDNKRRIRVLNPQYLSSVEEEFKKLINVII